MEIEPGKVVAFHYRLTNPEGQLLDSSPPERPAVYLHGRGSIVRGLESKMRGHSKGDKFTATIAPEHAYGMYDDSGRKRVPKKHLVRPANPRVGQFVLVNTRRGEVRGVVLKVGKFNVDVDFNHPFAGQTLVFEVEVVEVRDPTPEELGRRPGGAAA